MAKRIEVYSMKTCPHCVRAKGLLQSRGVVFEEIEVGMDDVPVWTMLYEKSGGMRTVPQIYCDGDYRWLPGTCRFGQGGWLGLAEVSKENILDDGITLSPPGSEGVAPALFSGQDAHAPSLIKTM